MNRVLVSFRSRALARASAITLLGWIVGCGGASKPEVASGGSQESAAPASSWEPAPLPDEGAIKLLGLTGPDKAWDSMSYDEKEWYMVGKVHPVMRQVFQTFNASKYEGEKFECTPCHGENPEARKYKMPSDHLSPVPAFGTKDWKTMENARIFKFMTKRVTPAIGQVLGKEAWNPDTGEGYSCWGCHPPAQ